MTAACLQTSPAQPSGMAKVMSALFYAASSFLITVVNKTVLTSYRFPSYACLAIGQMAATIVILYVAKKSSTVQFQDFDRSVFHKIFPLPLLYTGNHITGLGSTKKLSLPMFTVLRKFTILMTMVLEVYLLRSEDVSLLIQVASSVLVRLLVDTALYLSEGRGYRTKKTFSRALVYSVLIIVAGALIAASSDLAFEMEGYVFILLNDAFTAAYGVYTKKKLGAEGLGKYGVLFYNALIIIIPITIVCAYTGDLDKALTFQDWTKVPFLLCFIMSCIMGFVLMYSIVLCSHYNSALTTTVVGAIKNVAVAYIGIFVGGDYVFSWTNFLGLTICMSGGLFYSYLSFNTTPEGTVEEVKTDATENPPETHPAKD